MKFFEIKDKEIIPGIPVLLTKATMGVDTSIDECRWIKIDSGILVGAEVVEDARGKIYRVLQGGVGSDEDPNPKVHLDAAMRVLENGGIKSQPDGFEVLARASFAMRGHPIGNCHLIPTPVDDEKRGDRILALYRFSYKDNVTASTAALFDITPGCFGSDRPDHRNNLLARGMKSEIDYARGVVTHRVAALLVMPAGEHISLGHFRTKDARDSHRLNYEGDCRFTFGENHEPPPLTGVERNNVPKFYL